MIRYPSIISLPNLRLYFHQDIFAEEYFMVAGGHTPELSWLKAAAAGRTLYCVDHGADACRAAGLSPSFFIGDGDSAGEDTLKWLQSSNAEIRRYPPEKDKTDTQLALELVAKKRTTSSSFPAASAVVSTISSACCILSSARAFAAVSPTRGNSSSSFAAGKASR